MARRAVFPGSFNPLTVAHLTIAETVVDRHGVTTIDLVLSRVALAKEHVDRPLVEHRLDVLAAASATRPWLGAQLTDNRLIADIAEGYDLLVVGADKWAQIHDPAFYESERARDDALARLPEVVVIPRPPHEVPAHLVLELADDLSTISSTAVRDGRHEWMAEEARRFDERTGAWTEPERYERWLTR
jgi:nicotinic acid mononucleotide adenylyltransferase